ncbi:MAG: hypothetical protein KKD29_00160 [Candidatus Omnitrophica bacterium]|nr:hypothetical protein [Candidatus Omnitrophota bacterium]
MGADLTFEFKVNLKKVRHASPRYHMAKIVNEPRLRQTLVLAYQVQKLLKDDKAKTMKQVAQWLNMTPARISQIMNLLFLAPDIQKEILLSKNEKVHQLTEYKIFKIIMEIDWQKQRAMWNDLLA